MDLIQVIHSLPNYNPDLQSEGFTFDADRAQRAIDFFPDCLTFSKGDKGKHPFELELWEQAIIGNLYGWVDALGKRRFQEVFILVPRKNGKSELAAGIACLELFCGKEYGAEIYSAAAAGKQAALVFSAAKKMIQNSTMLKKRAEILQYSIRYPLTDATYKAIASDSNTAHGLNASCLIIDELHAIEKRDFVDTLTTSMGSRHGLTVYISTSDFDRDSIYNEVYNRACKARDNQGSKLDIGYDPRLLPCIWEALPSDNWRDEKIWAKANPNLGHSVKLDFLRRECKKAEETPSYLNTFKRLFLNIKTSTNYAWLDMDDWNKCPNAIEPKALIGQRCYGHLDLGLKDDLAAFVLFFPESKAVLPWFWCPDDMAEERSRRDRVNYVAWRDAGLMDTTPGDTIDYDFIKTKVREIAKTYKPIEISYDPWNANQIALQFQNDGLNVIEFPQVPKYMNEPAKFLEVMVKKHEVNHGNNPILRWMAGNASVYTDPNGNIKVSKKSSKEKVDGIVALVCAIGRSMLGGNVFKSVYSERGILTVNSQGEIVEPKKHKALLTPEEKEEERKKSIKERTRRFLSDGDDD